MCVCARVRAWEGGGRGVKNANKQNATKVGHITKNID